MNGSWERNYSIGSPSGLPPARRVPKSRSLQLECITNRVLAKNAQIAPLLAYVPLAILFSVR